MHTLQLSCGIARRMAGKELGGGALFGFIYGPISIVLLILADSIWRASIGNATSPNLSLWPVYIAFAAVVGPIVGLVTGLVMLALTSALLTFGFRCLLRRVADTPRYRALLQLACGAVGGLTVLLSALLISPIVSGSPYPAVVWAIVVIIPALAAALVAWRSAYWVVDWAGSQTA